MTDFMSTDAVKPGKFVVFEGLDGAGTTTQLNMLANWLREHGVAIETTSEPTGGPIGGVLRQAIDRRAELAPEALALAFAADRVDHLFNPVNGINRWLAAGTWVLCDRYLFSSLAYQSVDGLPIDWLIEINKFAHAPDVTIFVDTDTDVCMDRINSRSQKDELYHIDSRLRATVGVYRKIIANGSLTGQLMLVDGNNKPEDVFGEMIHQFDSWLNRTHESD